MSPHFPRTESYDAAWVEKNSMGPNVLWLMESLCTEQGRPQGEASGGEAPVTTSTG